MSYLKRCGNKRPAFTGAWLLGMRSKRIATAVDKINVGRSGEDAQCANRAIRLTIEFDSGQA